jgi:tungstate transport system substrate-binding protein
LKLRTILVAVVATTLSASCSRAPSVLHLSTTTSVENSGLLKEILPKYQAATGVDVQAVAVGSGRALAILESGDADVALTHDPDAEQGLMDRAVVARYRKIMYNDFVLAGPPADPAQVKQSTDALDAMRRIAASKHPFASRGDSSGTHAREQQLWKDAGVKPDTAALLETGSGMAATLRVASERQAYVLTDRATLVQLSADLRLAIVHEHDARYINTYAVMTRAGLSGGKLTVANQLFDWLATGDGRKLIADFRVKGLPAFTIWPAAAPADHPSALPDGR